VRRQSRRTKPPLPLKTEQLQKNMIMQKFFKVSIKGSLKTVAI
jgi:hypothetical protein